MSNSQREYDIILLGATGFTGKRAARYLSSQAPEQLRIGLAARNAASLSVIAEEVGVADSDLFVVDTLDEQQVLEVVSKTRILITTVGPYSLYGEHVIAGCAKAGTHYLDITGEVGFIKSMADKYGETAKKSGAILIPFSGFDSVPAEVSMLLLSREFDPSEEVYIKSYYSLKGGLNGGTIATMLNKFETGEYKLMSNPRLAMDSNEQQIGKATDQYFTGYDSSLKRWVTPFIMSGINSKVLYRSSDIFRNREEPLFKSIAYSEHASLGRWYNPTPFITTLLSLLLIQKLGPFSWFRKLVRTLAPAPGEGPSEKSIEEGFFKITSIANSTSGKRASVACSYPGDPSNKATVFFLCESALALLEKLESRTTLTHTGFLTPSTALGNELITRLSSKGYSINT
ncbi:MAG: hypothetical protein ED557_04180 [Balneola sp.]|nr:MAG: hypothetical protein ED557_04180 [Balneola sp.]